ncbi:MAG: hypothetical protein Q9182_006476 [Xanthomendoza sp. 2 TL-2023]
MEDGAAWLAGWVASGESLWVVWKATWANPATQVWDPTQRLAGMSRDAARVTEQRLRVHDDLHPGLGNSSRPIGGSQGLGAGGWGADCLGDHLFGANTTPN